MNSWVRHLLVALLFSVLAYAYTYPGGKLMLASSTTEFMSDGTDPTSISYQYAFIHHLTRSNPVELLYGAIPNRLVNAPEGLAMWVPWIEKIAAVLITPLVANEQVSTAVVLFLLLLNAISFYMMGLTARWPASVSIALAICWAFNPFTRARAQVHMAMSGTFHLPLIFLGIFSLIRWPNRKGIAIAAASFLFAAMALHYFVVLTLPFIPFLLWFYYLDPTTRVEWRRSTLRLLIAALPAIMFLSWSILKPIPSEMVSNNALVLPKTGEFKDESGIHPFLKWFYARPMDYFAGDTAIGPGDINPVRKILTGHIRDNLNQSNAHERTNGIRWSILLITVLIIASLCGVHPLIKWTAQRRAQYLFFIAFIVFGFLLSASPMIGDHAIGLSSWLHRLIPQFRVPNRAGIFVHFGCLLIAGYFLLDYLKTATRKTRNIALLLPLIAIVDFPPFLNDMPVAKIQPRYTSLTYQSGPCGSGMFFPYISGNSGGLDFYYFLQRMRGTTCSVINRAEQSPRDDKLVNTFGLHKKNVDRLNAQDILLKTELIRFVGCTGMQWLAFHPNLSSHWANSVCAAVNGTMTEKDVCMRTGPFAITPKSPDLCL